MAKDGNLQSGRQVQKMQRLARELPRQQAADAARRAQAAADARKR